MTMRSHGSRITFAALVVVGVLSTAAFGFFDSFKVCAIEGYLDRAPDGATIVARLDIGAAGSRQRQLLVTSYRSRGGLFERQLSAEPYLLRGNPGDVLRLLGAPEGTKVEGTFAVYPEAIPSLLIASLDRPA